MESEGGKLRGMERISHFLRSSEKKAASWKDWHWQVANAVRELEDSKARECFGVSITPYYLSLLDTEDPSDPLRKMVIPDVLERRITNASEIDPIREEEHAILPGMIRRYPDRVLLLVSGDCPVSCRHCTRRKMGSGKVVPIDSDGLEKAVQYIRDNVEIRDVIVSGGEPLLLEDDELFSIVTMIRSIPSVEIIRIATRAPVTLPMRITPELVQGLKRFSPLFVNTHFNHPRELTGEAVEAAGRFIDAGIPVNNQAVLLAGVNDDEKIMEELCRGLLRARIRPYYLFMCDLVSGTEHFWVPLEKAIGIMEKLRGNLSGLAIPQLVVDLPGGLGKVPVGPNYIVEKKDGKTILRAPNGIKIHYMGHYLDNKE